MATMNPNDYTLNQETATHKEEATLVDDEQYGTGGGGGGSSSGGSSSGSGSSSSGSTSGYGAVSGVVRDKDTNAPISNAIILYNNTQVAITLSTGLYSTGTNIIINSTASGTLYIQHDDYVLGQVTFAQSVRTNRNVELKKKTIAGPIITYDDNRYVTIQSNNLDYDLPLIFYSENILYDIPSDFFYQFYNSPVTTADGRVVVGDTGWYIYQYTAVLVDNYTTIFAFSANPSTEKYSQISIKDVVVDTQPDPGTGGGDEPGGGDDPGGGDEPPVTVIQLTAPNISFSYSNGENKITITNPNTTVSGSKIKYKLNYESGWTEKTESSVTVIVNKNIKSVEAQCVISETGYSNSTITTYTNIQFTYEFTFKFIKSVYENNVNIPHNENITSGIKINGSTISLNSDGIGVLTFHYDNITTAKEFQIENSADLTTFERAIVNYNSENVLTIENNLSSFILSIYANKTNDYGKLTITVTYYQAENKPIKIYLDVYKADELLTYDDWYSKYRFEIRKVSDSIIAPETNAQTFEPKEGENKTIYVEIPNDGSFSSSNKLRIYGNNYAFDNDLFPPEGESFQFSPNQHWGSFIYDVIDNIENIDDTNDGYHPYQLYSIPWYMNIVNLKFQVRDIYSGRKEQLAFPNIILKNISTASKNDPNMESTKITLWEDGEAKDLVYSNLTMTEISKVVKSNMYSFKIPLYQECYPTKMIIKEQTDDSLNFHTYYPTDIIIKYRNESDSGNADKYELLDSTYLNTKFTIKANDVSISDQFNITWPTELSDRKNILKLKYKGNDSNKKFDNVLISPKYSENTRYENTYIGLLSAKYTNFICHKETYNFPSEEPSPTYVRYDKKIQAFPGRIGEYKYKFTTDDNVEILSLTNANSISYVPSIDNVTINGIDAPIGDDGYITLSSDIESVLSINQYSDNQKHDIRIDYQIDSSTNSYFKQPYYVVSDPELVLKNCTFTNNENVYSLITDKEYDSSYYAGKHHQNAESANIKIYMIGDNDIEDNGVTIEKTSTPEAKKTKEGNTIVLRSSAQIINNTDSSGKVKYKKTNSTNNFNSSLTEVDSNYVINATAEYNNENMVIATGNSSSNYTFSYIAKLVDLDEQVCTYSSQADNTLISYWVRENNNYYALEDINYNKNYYSRYNLGESLFTEQGTTSLSSNMQILSIDSDNITAALVNSNKYIENNSYYIYLPIGDESIDIKIESATLPTSIYNSYLVCKTIGSSNIYNILGGSTVTLKCDESDQIIYNLNTRKINTYIGGDNTTINAPFGLDYADEFILEDFINYYFDAYEHDFENIYSRANLIQKINDKVPNYFNRFIDPYERDHMSYLTGSPENYSITGNDSFKSFLTSGGNSDTQIRNKIIEHLSAALEKGKNDANDLPENQQTLKDEITEIYKNYVKLYINTEFENIDRYLFDTYLFTNDVTIKGKRFNNFSEVSIGTINIKEIICDRYNLYYNSNALTLNAGYNIKLCISNSSLDVTDKHDIYVKQRAGVIQDFTGVYKSENTDDDVYLYLLLYYNNIYIRSLRNVKLSKIIDIDNDFDINYRNTSNQSGFYISFENNTASDEYDITMNIKYVVQNNSGGWGTSWTTVNSNNLVNPGRNKLVLLKYYKEYRSYNTIVARSETKYDIYYYTGASGSINVEVGINDEPQEILIKKYFNIILKDKDGCWWIADTINNNITNGDIKFKIISISPDYASINTYTNGSFTFKPNLVRLYPAYRLNYANTYSIQTLLTTS